MYRGMRVAVVIPAHDEATLLPTTLAGLPDFVDGVYVVDDASTDGTGALARRAGAHVLHHRDNQGVGAAIVTGYRAALAGGFDVAVVVGADAQMDPVEMPRLLDPIADDIADYVKGDRLGHPEVRRRMPRVRYLGNHVLSRLTSVAIGHRVRDAQCGYTAIRRSTLARVPLDRLYPRYGFPNDLLARLAEVDARIVDRPVSPIYGRERSGLRIPRVIAPISWLLVRALARRLLRPASLVDRDSPLQRGEETPSKPLHTAREISATTSISGR